MKPDLPGKYFAQNDIRYTQAGIASREIYCSNCFQNSETRERRILSARTRYFLVELLNKKMELSLKLMSAEKKWMKMKKFLKVQILSSKNQMKVQIFQSHRLRRKESMAINKEKEFALERFRVKLGERIANSYGNVVQTINESLNRILQSAILNAESLEEFVKTELSELDKLIFHSENIRNESGQLHNWGKNVPKNNKNPDKNEFVYKENQGSVSNENNITDLLDSSYNIKVEDGYENNTTLNILDRQEAKFQPPMPRKHTKNVERTGSRFECEECDYSATQKSNLTTHIKSKHKRVLEFECNQCEGSFVRECDLSKHMRTKHNN